MACRFHSLLCVERTENAPVRSTRAVWSAQSCIARNQAAFLPSRGGPIHSADIEDITTKTGSFKKFEVFAKMLLSAITEVRSSPENGRRPVLREPPTRESASAFKCFPNSPLQLPLCLGHHDAPESKWLMLVLHRTPGSLGERERLSRPAHVR